MKHRVIEKQKNTKMCFLCGLKNQFGLRGQFFELDNKELVCLFRPTVEHQSYPGRLHGGIISAVLDETIGRAIMIHNKEAYWGVTVDFSVRFKRQVPINEELRAVGRITNETSQMFEGTGELLLPSGEVAATGHGKYVRLPIEKIADFDATEQEWKVTASKDDPDFLEL